VLSYGEDPEEPELNGWEKLGVHSWIVPNNVPTNRLFDSLAYGGWALYQSQPRCELANDLMWKLISGSGEMKINTPDFKATISFILMSNLDNDPWTLRVAGA
jgi:hypothetical protein